MLHDHENHPFDVKLPSSQSEEIFTLDYISIHQKPLSTANDKFSEHVTGNTSRAVVQEEGLISPARGSMPAKGNNTTSY